MANRESRKSVYVIIHGKVYDVANFLDEHPGGKEVILADAGQDATEAFEDVGHSDEARALLPGMFVGELTQSTTSKSTTLPNRNPTEPPAKREHVPDATLKIVTPEELTSHRSRDSPYVSIHGKVYDISQFLDEHPGGDEVLLAEAGQDATEIFEDIGHSDEARALLPGMLVGELGKSNIPVKQESIPDASLRIVTLEELRAHRSPSSFYVLIHGKVYDVTQFLSEHPGGDDVILTEAGEDSTEVFEDVGHSDEARALLPDMLVGTLGQSKPSPTVHPNPRQHDRRPGPRWCGVVSTPAVADAAPETYNSDLPDEPRVPGALDLPDQARCRLM